MRKLLYPRSIAVLGASDNPIKLSGRPIDYMKRFGYQGCLLPINPTRDVVQGLPAYRSIDDVEGDIDLAMIVLPAERAVEAVRACGEHGIPYAIVVASGFAETNPDGAALQEELRTAAAETGIRVLGPNCLGMIGVANRALVTFSSALDDDIELHAGSVGFVSQSGAFGSFIFSEAQQNAIGVAHYINTGNEVDLSVAEVLGSLVDNNETKVLLAYMEGISDGRRLLEVARQADAADKPIIAVKVGRSEAGARAAQSHTASLAGEDAVFDGVAKQFGIIRVDGTEAMLDAAQIFSTSRRATGRKLTVLTGSGGAAVLMADAASTHGLKVEPWDEAWQAKMAAVIPAYGTPRNPIDLTGTLAADPNLLRQSLDIALANPDTDMIVILLGNSDRTADMLVETLIAGYDSTDKPVAVVWTGGGGRPRRELRNHGIPCYVDAGRAAASLAALADYSLRTPNPIAQRPAGLDRPTAEQTISDVRANSRVQLDEEESSRLIAAYGIPTAPYRTAIDATGTIAAFVELDGPVAVKILSSSIAHKSDLGGVRLGLHTESEVRAAAEDLLDIAKCHGAPDARLLIQQMADPGTELIIGIKSDPAFGPVVVAGFGGVLVEVLGDSQVAAAPADHDSVRRLLLGLRGSKLFGAVRGQPARDLDAVIDAIVRLSWLASDFADDLDELDVNPLIVGPAGAGALAVDSVTLLTVPTTPRSI